MGVDAVLGRRRFNRVGPDIRLDESAALALATGESHGSL
jgi:hypothetical protein